MGKALDEEQVAIPLKRGKSSTMNTNNTDLLSLRRNPLEAGQKFNLHLTHQSPVSSLSRNPLEAGQKFNLLF